MPYRSKPWSVWEEGIGEECPRVLKSTRKIPHTCLHGCNLQCPSSHWGASLTPLPCLQTGVMTAF